MPNLDINVDNPLEQRINRLHHYRPGNRTDYKYPAFARIHQLQDVLFEGKRWDAYEMEITDPRTGKVAYGKCLWVGQSLEGLLLKGERSSRTWLRERFGPYPERVGEPDYDHLTRNCFRDRSRARRSLSFPTEGYCPTELSRCPQPPSPDVDDLASRMAGLSLEESSESERS